jgi:hypothetical protein
MTPHQYDLLRALSKGPRTLRSFTHSPTVEQTRVSPFVIELNMGKLVAAGFVMQMGLLYALTNEGAKQIDLATPQPKLAIPTETFKGTVFRIRPGGEDHLKHASRGERC